MGTEISDYFSIIHLLIFELGSCMSFLWLKLV